MATVMQILVILSFITMAMGVRVRRKTIYRFTQKPENKYTVCIVNNTEGICVHETACNNDHNLMEYGMVEDFNFRNKQPCPNPNDWCCATNTSIFKTDDTSTTKPHIRPTGVPLYTSTYKPYTRPSVTRTDTSTYKPYTRPSVTRTDTSTYKPYTRPSVTRIDTSTNQPYTRPTSATSGTQNECLVLKTDACPWCVLLYKTAIGARPTEVSPFCVGAFIGSKKIITASTCLLAAKNRMLYAQIPHSANPEKKYTILLREFHPRFDTGSHENDFGLLVMEADVSIQMLPRACLDFFGPLEGTCLGYGFDQNGGMVSTILQVKSKSCGKAGNTVDAACGTNADDVCMVEYGAPILCQNQDGGLVLRGISRGRCDRYDKILIGGISHSKSWIEEQLNL